MATGDYRDENCPLPPFQGDIEKLENDSNIQDQTDAKAKLASLKKISGEVEQTENQYKKDFESLKFKEKQSAAYEAGRKEQLEAGVPESERETIKEIVTCYDSQAGKLKEDWLALRNSLPALQKDLSEKQNAATDSEATYQKALDYNANQKNLNALQAQGETEIGAGNLRGAYFLVEVALLGGLKEPLPPDQFNSDLEKKARDYYDRSNVLRAAKVKFDQTAADAQKKKKAYEDAKAKRKENILKQIADEPFPTLADEAASIPTGDPRSGGTAQAV